MITAYVFQANKLSIVELNIRDSVPEGTLWLDLYKPEDDERE